MNEVLSREETDALLAGLADGAIDVEPGPEKPKSEIKPYRFGEGQPRNPGGLLVLELINERVVREFERRLGEMLRRPVRVTFKPTTRIRYAVYVRLLSIPLSLNTVTINPLPGTALMTLDSDLVFVLVDHYFGGNGQVPMPETRNISRAELRVVQVVLLRLFAALADGWSVLAELDCELTGSEVDPHFVQVARPTEMMLVLRMKVQVGDSGGELHVLLPETMIEPYRELLEGEAPSSDANRKFQAQMRARLQQINVQAWGEIARTRMLMRDLVGLAPGDVIPIAEPEAATLCVGRTPVLSGRLGVSEGRNALRIAGRYRAPGEEED